MRREGTRRSPESRPTAEGSADGTPERCNVTGSRTIAWWSWAHRLKIRVTENQPLFAWCQRERITFTRSRPWKKNDSAHVEQKNGAIVRHLVGYDRFTSHAAYAQLTRVYQLARLHVNSFEPVQKLVSKTRAGARTRRFYDRAQTPYQRLCTLGVLPPATRDELEALYQSLNPLQLRRDMDAALDRLWSLAAPDPRRAQGDTQIATPSLKSSPGGS